MDGSFGANQGLLEGIGGTGTKSSTDQRALAWFLEYVTRCRSAIRSRRSLKPDKSAGRIPEVRTRNAALSGLPGILEYPVLMR